MIINMDYFFFATYIIFCNNKLKNFILYIPFCIQDPIIVIKKGILIKTKNNDTIYEENSIV